MKRVVATAYAINPFKGSEDAMGWNFVMQIARFHQVYAITRENNRTHIEQYMQMNPDSRYQNINFLYFDLPYWMRFWKKGGRGAMLYYLMWQRGVVGFIRQQNIEFDLVHNLNFHNDWTPSFLWKLGKPFVWGPVGHHPLIPSRYLKPHFKSYLLKDRLTWLVKLYFWYLSPSLATSLRKAGHVWCMNTAVPKRLGLNSRYSVAPSVATQDQGWKLDRPDDQPFTVISAGRLVALKGFDLTVRSFASFINKLPESQRTTCNLLIVGSGPALPLLQKLVQEEKISDHVKFISWIERDELLKLFRDASVFLFPSHEGAGMVVAEALSFGVPVVCLDNEGPGQYITPDCGITVSQLSYTETVHGLGDAVLELFINKEKHTAMRRAARLRFETAFHWDRRGEQLTKIYESL